MLPPSRLLPAVALSTIGVLREVGVDRAAKDRLGAGGYAHVLAQRIQQRGTDVYVHTDVVYPRADRPLYQHVFAQVEGGHRIVYYIGVVELQPGFGYVLVTEPEDGDAPSMDADFYKLLDTLQVVPAGAAAGRPRCSWRAARHSISSWSATRPISLTRRPSMPSSIRTTCTSSSTT